MLHGRIDQGVALLGNADVGSNRESLRARIARDVGDGAACRLEISAGDDNFRAVIRKGCRRSRGRCRRCRR